MENGRPLHEPVLIMAVKSCEKCEMAVPSVACGSCSPDGRFFSFSRLEAHQRDQDVMELFGLWLFRKEHYGFVAVAHNLKGYNVLVKKRVYNKLQIWWPVSTTVLFTKRTADT